MEKKENVKKENTVVKIAIILSILFVTCNVIIMGIFITKSVINTIKQNKEIEYYESRVLDYMKDEYNENFNVKLASKGYKRNVSGLDGSTFYCGHDKNMKEYIFEVKPENGEGTAYVTVWKNIKTGEITIRESYGSSYADTSYKLAKEINIMKKELEEIVKKSYSNFSIYNELDTSLEGENNVINISIKESYKSELNKDCDLISKLIDYLDKKETIITVEFNGIFATISDNTNLERVKNMYKHLSDIENYMDANYNKKYSIYNDSDYNSNIKIKIFENFVTSYKENKEMYNKIYNGLIEMDNNYLYHTKLVFTDTDISIDYYEPNRLEKTYNEGVNRLRD